MFTYDEFSQNDWRYYTLMHRADKGESKYDWSSGTNPSDYNHDYWEAHKDEIMAKRRQKNGAVRDFGGSGVGYKAKKDGTTGEHLSDYENDDDWSDELTADELKNIDAHNKQVDANIAALTKSVEDYIAANAGKLTPDQIAKLRADLRTQISIANEQRINTKNSDDYNYIMSFRKSSGSSSKGPSRSSEGSSKRSSNSSSRPSTNAYQTAKANTKSVSYNEKKNDSTDTRQQRNEQLEERRYNNRFVDDFNYYNEEARRRKEEQERIRYAGRR